MNCKGNYIFVNFCHPPLNNVNTKKKGRHAHQKTTIRRDSPYHMTGASPSSSSEVHAASVFRVVFEIKRLIIWNLLFFTLTLQSESKSDDYGSKENNTTGHRLAESR